MFTGLVESIGHVKSVQERGGDLRLVIEERRDKIAWQKVALGDSIATSGCCLTVVEKLAKGYAADVSRESLQHTTIGEWKAGTQVNLEQSLTPESKMGGHMVSGHVDGVGVIASIQKDARSWRYQVEAPLPLARYIAHKGSITVDGVSLTVNAVDDALFELSIVPHTMGETIIEGYQVGTRVNLEVDLIARYLERLLQFDTYEQAGDGGAQDKPVSRLTAAFLKDNGY